VGSAHTEALYREHSAAVAALCRSLLRDRGEAEDATQQVFLSAHRALLNGTVPREPLAWLLTVARNECYGRFRQRATTPVPTGEAPESATADASVHALRAGELASMWDEVGQMPHAQREAFLLREIGGLSYGQVGTELSLSPPSVRSLLLRARTRLRHRLGDVAAGLGGAQWVQALLRIVGGGDSPSPVPAAAKVAAVGLGALALAGGESRSLPAVTHHASTPPSQHPATHRPTEARVRHVAVPLVVGADVRREDQRSEHPGRRERGSRGSGSRGGTDDNVASVSGGAIESSRDSSDSSGETPTTTTTQTSSSGHDSGSDGGSSSVTVTTSSGSDGGSGSVTTTTATSDGHDGGTGGSPDGGSGTD
jgi:RNA polymerase sigma-70 factor (ECF subfamily)